MGKGLIAPLDTKHMEDKAYLETLIGQIQSRRFFGKVVLIYEDGILRRVTKEESLLPPNARGG